MKILGLDTTTKFLCLGIYDENKIYEYNLEVGIKLSSLLNLTIKRTLDALGLSINKIDYFASGLGPGSFTGVRIGLATIKGMSWALKKPVIGISSLDILAQNVREIDNLVIPIIDAKRGFIYYSIYKNKNGSLIRIAPYVLSDVENLIKKIKPKSVILGDAVNLYKEMLLRNIKGVTILDKDYWYPQPRNILKLALNRIRDKKLDEPFKIKPIYLYPKECQIRENRDRHQFRCLSLFSLFSR